MDQNVTELLELVGLVLFGWLLLAAAVIVMSAAITFWGMWRGGKDWPL